MAIRRALISVSDKRGIAEFAKGLQELGVEIISTGGTARLLEENGIPVRPISELTGFPEMLDGRVKTLHPKVHGALLARRDDPEHMRQVTEHGIELIDMVVVNLYPFRSTAEKPGVGLEELTENIDIGGPTMIRSAAKNYRDVAVVTDPGDYVKVLEELKATGDLSEETRARLCVKAFRTTADYDATIDRVLSRKLLGERVLHLSLRDGKVLRYGENAHQRATFYVQGLPGSCIANARQLWGKDMSYNNYLDADGALEAVRELKDASGVAVIKHTNPCGYATGETLKEALKAAWEGDPVSAFGSIIACTRPMDLETAKFLRGRFVEISIAPGYDEDALEFLKSHKKDLRILEVPPLDLEPDDTIYRYVRGGMLEQDRDGKLIEKWEVVTKAQFPEGKRALAEFAYKAVKHTKSNAIVLAREYKPRFFQVLGVGAGQPNRVDSLRKLALTKARENLERFHKAEAPELPLEDYIWAQLGEVVLASDAFFPFPDVVEYAAEAGIRYIVQPGGSVRDEEVISTADRLGVAMAFTGTRHFLH
ncbi:MAG TPA: bifunctional phosphoribosylaminoimidazolecarboxamide formyltransferase/IMP cyclohydrolase [Candidatus Latescibacteria bacterium]|nr:bifunctional phosphoribosylaminoimidazolecarboxamide formyltransferase/IMP cyclohydrolase [Candidatus Latescibacterota bacterium]